MAASFAAQLSARGAVVCVDVEGRLAGGGLEEVGLVEGQLVGGRLVRGRWVGGRLIRGRWVEGRLVGCRTVGRPGGGRKRFTCRPPPSALRKGPFGGSQMAGNARSRGAGSRTISPVEGLPAATEPGVAGLSGDHRHTRCRTRPCAQIHARSSVFGGLRAEPIEAATRERALLEPHTKKRQLLAESLDGGTGNRGVPAECEPWKPTAAWTRAESTATTRSRSASASAWASRAVKTFFQVPSTGPVAAARPGPMSHHSTTHWTDVRRSGRGALAG